MSRKKTTKRKRQSPRRQSPKPSSTPVGDQPETTDQRVPLATCDSLIAAWKAGRLLGSLAFHAKRAWFPRMDCRQLQIDGQQRAEIVRLWDCLARTVRDLAANVRGKDRLSDRVQMAKAGFLNSLGSESHHELLLDANAEAGGPSLDLEAICAGLLTPVQAAMIDLLETIESELDEVHKRILRLGQFLDELVHPIEAHSQMWVMPPREPTSWNGSGSSPEPCGPEWMLPTPPFPTSEIMPGESWFEELAKRWSELEPFLGPLPPLMTTAMGDAGGSVGELAQEIGQKVRNVLAQASGVVQDGTIVVPFIPDATQKRILSALDGVAMRTDAIARVIGGDRRVLFDRGNSPGKLFELIKHNRVKHIKKIGYFRPDRPPPELDVSSQ